MSRELTAVERLLLKAMAPVSIQLEGYVIAFGEEVLRTHGIQGFVQWSKLTWATRARLRKAFGARTEHLLSCFASFWNGCGYCAHGNLFAHNLMLYRDEGEVFPLDEDQLLGMHDMADDEVVAKIDELLAEAHPDAVRLVRRQFEIKRGMAPENDEDELLWLSLRLYDFINECSIVVNPPAPAFDKVARDHKLISRYREARAAA